MRGIIFSGRAKFSITSTPISMSQITRHLKTKVLPVALDVLTEDTCWELTYHTIEESVL